MKNIFAIAALTTISLIHQHANAQTYGWAGKLGGVHADYGYSIALDSHGNVYTTGVYQTNGDFNPGSQNYSMPSAGGNDAFISKLDASGNFVWAKHLGGPGADGANYIAVDAAGNVYTTGHFTGTADFDPNAGTYELTSAGNNDVFVCKLDSSGDFIWARGFGGDANDDAISIAVDAGGNVYTTGYFNDTADLDPGINSLEFTSLGGSDVFVSKLNESGDLVWAKQMGGVSGESAYALAVDADGNVYTVGNFNLTADFDPGAADFDLTSAGAIDVFISKLDASGNFVWAKQFGGTSDDYAGSVAVNAASELYITGFHGGSTDFDPGSGTYFLDVAGAYDNYVCKLDESGDFIWAEQFGGTDVDYAISIVLDENENIYTTGFFFGTADFDPGVGVSNLTSGGNYDIYVSKLDVSGSFVWAVNMGGPSGDFGNALSLDADGNVYLTGYFNDTADFDPGTGVHLLGTTFGSSDVFVERLNAGTGTLIGLSDHKDVVTIGPNPSDGLITVTSNNSLGKISIMNSQGQIVQQVNTSEKIFSLMIPQPGIYLLLIADEERTITKKIIVNAE